jgi:hypothetical protein
MSVHANVYLVAAQVPLLEKMRKNVKKKTFITKKKRKNRKLRNITKITKMRKLQKTDKTEKIEEKKK